MQLQLKNKHPSVTKYIQIGGTFEFSFIFLHTIRCRRAKCRTKFEFETEPVIFGTLINCAVITIFDCWFYGEISIFDSCKRVSCRFYIVYECVLRLHTIMDSTRTCVQSTMCTQQTNEMKYKKHDSDGGSFECFPSVFQLNLKIFWLKGKISKLLNKLLGSGVRSAFIHSVYILLLLLLWIHYTLQHSLFTGRFYTWTDTSMGLIVDCVTNECFDFE